jgi:hypothetical protein
MADESARTAHWGDTLSEQPVGLRPFVVSKKVLGTRPNLDEHADGVAHVAGAAAALPR